MECSPSTSASTIRVLHSSLSKLAEQSTSVSHVSPLASSPESSPSLAASPSTDSISSLPSVSSSFFFSSSAATSPPHHGSNPRSGSSERGLDQEHGLIIPFLTLPDALKRPTPFGQTLGDLRLLVLGAQGAEKSFFTGLLMEDNEDVVEVGTWEDSDDHAGKVLKASTDWVEVKDGLGMEKFEPLRNVEIVELPGYDYDTDVSDLPFFCLYLINVMVDR